MMGVAFVFGISIACRYILFTVAGERVVMNLRSRLYGHILSQEIGFFDQRRTGELVSRLAADTSVIQSAVSVNLSMTLRNLVQTLGALGFLVVTSAKLTGLMLVIVPAVALGAVIYGRRVRRLAEMSRTPWPPRGKWPKKASLAFVRSGAFVGEKAKSPGTPPPSKKRLQRPNGASLPAGHSWRWRRFPFTARPSLFFGSAAKWSPGAR